MGLVAKGFTLQEIGKRLRARREKLGMTQAIVAHRSKTCSVYVSNVELGKTASHVDAIRRTLLDAELQNRRWRKAEEELAVRRSFMEAVPSSPQKSVLIAAMLIRAEELLGQGKAEEADVILEFVPRDLGEKLLNDFFGEQS